MKREMTITVENESSATLFFDPKNTYLNHGKWVNKPEDVLQPSSSCEFKSEKQTGAAYGTEGQVIYKLVSSPPEPETHNLTISWDKPYGHGPTWVDVALVSTKYEASVGNKDFKKETASATVYVTDKV